MSSFSWEALSGTTIPDGFVLKRLMQETPYFALFQAHAASESQQPEALVELVIPQEASQTIVNRFLEASYLRHPNLAGISSAGMLDGHGEGHGLVYAIAEPVDHTLTQFIAQRPLPPDDALELVDQIVSALAYVHSENLVFCNLRPESIWRAATEWKLGDFSQLRVIGKGDSRELRATLARRPDLPPEVYDGVVSPAWDVWSLGMLLRRALATQPVPVEGAVSIPRNRPRNSDLPAPFDTIARDCLHPDPDARITVDEIRARLQPSRRSPQSTSAPGGVMTFLRTLPGERPNVRAWFTIACAAIVLMVMVLASLLRHSAPKVIAEAPAPIVVSEADRSVKPPPPAAANNALPGDVQGLLDKWVASTKARDAATNASCYAPTVDIYYGRQKLSHQQLVLEKARQFRTIGAVRRYRLDNVQFNQISPSQAVVLFDKQWSFGDRSYYSGSGREQLTLRNLGGEWKISGERELKVYWVRRGRLS